MTAPADEIFREQPGTQDEAQQWGDLVTASIMSKKAHWVRFARDEWFLEGPCPRCNHQFSIPYVIITTAIREGSDVIHVGPDEGGDAMKNELKKLGLAMAHAYLNCNCTEGHKAGPADDDDPTPGCGYAQGFRVVVPCPRLVA